MTYIIEPFAASGDKTPIPVAAQPDGSVSQTEGFGVDYELDPGTEPTALNIPRDQFNQLMNDDQTAIQELQQGGFPIHITASANGGTAYAYAKNKTVRATDGNNYYSLVDANADVPPSANWGLVVYGSPFSSGDCQPWDPPTLKTGGWLWQNGTTIGNAASNATQRSNADTAALFSFYWTQFPNAVLPIFNSDGTAGTRGVSAAADFAANKQMSLPDKCGRDHRGADNMGGITPKGRITVAECGIDGTVAGATGGIQSVQLTGNQNGTHAHTFGYINVGVNEDGTTTPINGVRAAGAGAEATTSNSGLGSSHQNVAPTFIGGGWIVKI